MKIIMCCRCKKKPGRRTKSGKYFCSLECLKKGERKKSKNFARNKGRRGESLLIKVCKNRGIIAEKQPLSGALFKKEFKNDVLIGKDIFSAEVKFQEKYIEAYKLIEGCKANIINNKQYPIVIKKRSNKPFLAEMYLEDLFDLIEECCVNKHNIRKRLWES